VTGTAHRQELGNAFNNGNNDGLKNRHVPWLCFGVILGFVHDGITNKAITQQHHDGS
jgi:hypothetical protein